MTSYLYETKAQKLIRFQQEIANLDIIIARVTAEKAAAVKTEADWQRANRQLVSLAARRESLLADQTAANLLA